MSKPIVPGVHDLIPPQGLVTVELLDQRGRVRKRERAENSIMNWLLNNVPVNGGRGWYSGDVTTPDYFRAHSFDPLATAQLIGNFAALGRHAHGARYGWPSQLHPIRMMDWIWATDSDATPNPGHTHIPVTDDLGEVTAGFRMNLAWAADGIQNKRGGITVVTSGTTRNQVRMVGEFAAGIGTGTYRSIGIGSLIAQEIAPGGLRPGPYPMDDFFTLVEQNVVMGSSGASFISDWQRATIDLDGAVYWAIDVSNNLYSGTIDGDQSGASATLEVSSGNIPGAGGSAIAVLTIAGNDEMWIGRDDDLFRCDKPTSNVAMTVNNTYDLSATLGAEDILDLATDGTNVFILTDTRIIEIDQTDGSVVGTVTHGITALTYGNIEWDVNEQGFWIGFYDKVAATDEAWGYATTSGQFDFEDADHLVIRCIDKTGTDTGKRFMLPQRSTSTDEQEFSMLFGAMSPVSGLSFTTCRNADVAEYLWRMTGPTMGSHALLGSDVVKAADDSLRITYDFNFTSP